MFQTVSGTLTWSLLAVVAQGTIQIRRNVIAV